MRRKPTTQNQGIYKFILNLKQMKNSKLDQLLDGNEDCVILNEESSNSIFGGWSNKKDTGTSSNKKDTSGTSNKKDSADYHAAAGSDTTNAVANF